MEEESYYLDILRDDSYDLITSEQDFYFREYCKLNFQGEFINLSGYIGEFANELSQKKLLHLLKAIVDNNSEITSVNLSKNNLSKIFASILFMFRGLDISTLYIERCKLNSLSLDLEVLSKYCKNLKVLGLEGNDLGSIDSFVDDSIVGNLQNLRLSDQNYYEYIYERYHSFVDINLEEESNANKNKLYLENSAFLNILYLSQLQSLQILDLSRNNLFKINKGLGVLTSLLSRNSSLEVINLSGNNLNKKAVLFSVAGFNEHRLSSDKSITILINSKKVYDYLSPKIVNWNEERQQENQENALSSYSICTREERKSGILNFRRNRLLMVDISILTQRKIASITAQIPRLWANDTRLSPQVSRVRKVSKKRNRSANSYQDDQLQKKIRYNQDDAQEQEPSDYTSNKVESLNLSCVGFFRKTKKDSLNILDMPEGVKVEVLDFLSGSYNKAFINLSLESNFS